MPTSKEKEDNMKTLVDLDIENLRTHLKQQDFNVETGVPENICGVENDVEWQKFMKLYSAFETEFKKLLVKKWSFIASLLPYGTVIKR